jgi:hypothetical protein
MVAVEPARIWEIILFQFRNRHRPALDPSAAVAPHRGDRPCGVNSRRQGPPRGRLLAVSLIAGPWRAWALIWRFANRLSADHQLVWAADPGTIGPFAVLLTWSFL